MNNKIDLEGILSKRGLEDKLKGWSSEEKQKLVGAFEDLAINIRYRQIEHSAGPLSTYIDERNGGFINIHDYVTYLKSLKLPITEDEHKSLRNKQ